MTKIVYNACYGGFGLSVKAVMRYAELKGIKLYHKKDSFVDLFYTVPLDEADKIRERIEATYSGKRNPTMRDYTELNKVCFSPSDIERDDPLLVQVVEELGEDASGNYANLQIAEVPTGSFYRIDEYDGSESVMTNSDYDWKVAR